MKCMIPLHQENYPANSLNRVLELADEVLLLYIIDRRILERARSESSYIIPADALDELESFIMKTHQERAESVKNRLSKYIATELDIVIGEYIQSIRKVVNKKLPDLVMSDKFSASLLAMTAPVWIDSGVSVSECTFFVDSLSRIKKLKNDMVFVRALCEKLGARLYLYYTHGDADGLKAVREMGVVTDRPHGELMVFQKDRHVKRPVKNANTLYV